MKILAISDTHADSKLIKKIAKIAKEENVDFIIHAGDITWFEKISKNIIGPLAKEKEVFMIPGNHESIKTMETIAHAYPNTKNIHKKGIEKDGIGIFGSGTTDWGIKEESKKVYEELKRAHSKISGLKKKIMVTHSPPSGSAIELLGFPGSYGVRKAIDSLKPDFLICGHIHEGGGLIEQIGKTKVLNVSQTPIIFEI